jgi:hypothetical protein
LPSAPRCSSASLPCLRPTRCPRPERCHACGAGTSDPWR